MSDTMSATEWIRHLDLQPHPEGGWFRETYRAEHHWPAETLAPAFSGTRSASTAIAYLLEAGDISHLHRLRQDEVWHHYAGGSCSIFCLSPEGAACVRRLGKNPATGSRPQLTVPAGHWFGAKPDPGVAYTLAGCTVAPGFEFEDFEMADRPTLLEGFPQHREWIETLTRP